MAQRHEIAPGVVRGEHFHPRDDGSVQCDLCPRLCRLHDGQHGFCFVREARDGQVALTHYGRASSPSIDPMEKQPLYHFFPGTGALSFGTAGCNLNCRSCPRWDSEKARAQHSHYEASPEKIVRAAHHAGVECLAFSHNDPVIFSEYMIDCAEVAHAHGVRTVAVTAGYISPQARPDFFRVLDAVNVDLKSFREGFYRKQCLAHLAPVLDTLAWVRSSTDVWLEVTTLLIPELNDSSAEIAELCRWIALNLGPTTPLHFSAFRPDHKLSHIPPTSAQTLLRARAIALEAGLQHVYTGNVFDPDGQSTYCTGCSGRLIHREGLRLLAYQLTPDGRCTRCGTRLAGHFDRAAGSWGARRLRLPLHAEF